MNSSPPRILIVVNVFRPDLGGGVLFADLCDGLRESGCEVFVKCAYPYYPQWADVSGKNGIRISTQKSDGYSVERHGIYIPSNPNSLAQRLIYEASFFLSLARRIPRRKDFDAILVFSPLIGSVGYAALVSAFTGIPVWLNVQDLSAQAASAGGIAGKIFGTSILERIQNGLFRRCHYWSSISEPMVSTLQSIKGAPKTVHLIPNWLHASLSVEIDTLKARRFEQAPLGEPKTNVDTILRPLQLLYSGNVGGKQDLLEFCKKLHESKSAFVLRIQAAGARLSELKKWHTSVSDPRFELLDLSDEAGLARALENADFYVITEKSGAGNSFIPSKLIPCISSGTPIFAICDVDGPLGQEITHHDLGYCMGWNAPDKLEHFLSQVVQDEERVLLWKTNTLKRAAFYNRASGISRCLAALNDVITIGHGHRSTDA